MNTRNSNKLNTHPITFFNKILKKQKYLKNISFCMKYFSLYASFLIPKCSPSTLVYYTVVQIKNDKHQRISIFFLWVRETFHFKTEKTICNLIIMSAWAYLLLDTTKKNRVTCNERIQYPLRPHIIIIGQPTKFASNDVRLGTEASKRSRILRDNYGHVKPGALCNFLVRTGFSPARRH